MNNIQKIAAGAFAGAALMNGAEAHHIGETCGWVEAWCEAEGCEMVYYGDPICDEWGHCLYKCDCGYIEGNSQCDAY